MRYLHCRPRIHSTATSREHTGGDCRRGPKKDETGRGKLTVTPPDVALALAPRLPTPVDREVRPGRPWDCMWSPKDLGLLATKGHVSHRLIVTADLTS